MMTQKQFEHKQMCIHDVGLRILNRVSPITTVCEWPVQLRSSKEHAC